MKKKPYQTKEDTANQVEEPLSVSQIRHAAAKAPSSPGVFVATHRAALATTIIAGVIGEICIWQVARAALDNIKKYGLAGLLLLGLNSLAPAQTETTKLVGEPYQIETKSVLHDSPFNGFHFGYTLEADLVHPVEMTNVNTGGKTFSSVRFGGRLGLELSYHFADFFGVSAALDYGYIGRDKEGVFREYYGLSMPVKFEFHYPISDKLWVAANVGVQLRMPWETFLVGYNRNNGERTYNLWSAQMPAIYDTYLHNRFVFYADLMLDGGVYYKLPNQNYLRFLLGLNVATTDYARGEVWIAAMGKDEQSVSQRNHYLYGQIAYLHSFHKQRAIKQVQPHWNANKSFYRHEFRLGVSDHFGFVFHREFGGDAVGENLSNTVCTDLLYTPVFSFDYHYRAAKWFWLGLSTGYGFYKESHYPDGIVSPDLRYWLCKQHNFLIMPSLRFSYLNRPHITLYSGLDIGLLIVRRTPERMNQFVDEGWSPDDDTSDWPHNRTNVFSAFQLTAFGVKAGAKHWFGSLELGAGIKGFVNLGVGYEF